MKKPKFTQFSGLMKAKSLTVKDVASMAKVTESCVRLWRAGQSHPNFNNAQRIIAELARRGHKVTLNEILG